MHPEDQLALAAVLIAFFGLLLLPVWADVIVIGGILAARQAGSAHRRQRAKNPVQIPTDALLLGTDSTGQPVLLTDEQMAAHAIIVGATGSGKTTTLIKMLTDAIAKNRPVVTMDLKGFPDFTLALHEACVRAGRDLHVWSFDGPGHWNPLRYGNASELKDKLISTERFTEPHYQRAAERYVQTALQVLDTARPDRPATLAAAVAVLDPTRLQSMLRHVPNELQQRVGPYLSSLNRDQRSAILGLQSRLAIMTESAPGAYLQPGPPEIDLRRALSGGHEVVLFSLNSSRYGKLAAQLAALVIQDLTFVSGYRQHEPSRQLAFVAIDEFSALDADNLLALIARARGAGISVLLSTQELADLDRAAQGFRDQVLGNTAITIAHRQNVPESAELIARMIGTDTVWQHTYQTGLSLAGQIFGNREARHKTGLGSMREVEQFRIHPNQIKELGTGQAVLITKLPAATAKIVRVNRPASNRSDHAN
jgi:type IV secretory pathway TraG/TraD family ATPase VirD4